MKNLLRFRFACLRQNQGDDKQNKRNGPRYDMYLYLIQEYASILEV